MPSILDTLEKEIEGSKLGRNFILVSWKPLEKNKYLLVMKYYMENRLFNWKLKKEFEKMIHRFEDAKKTKITFEYV